VSAIPPPGGPTSPALLSAGLRVHRVEDDEDDYVLARDLLEHTGRPDVSLHWVRSAEAGRAALLGGAHDVALVDFRLGATTGIDLLRDVAADGCRTPVILLTGQGDRATDLAAMASGAADYLVKGETTAPMLERAIRYALERQRLLEEIRALSIVDELTGLHNRRGFFTLAEQHLRVARREGRELALVYLDLDGLKALNDRLGHEAGDRAIAGAAAALRGIFRTGDIVARIGGDEFAVLVSEPADVPGLLKRISDAFATHEATHEAAQEVTRGAAPAHLPFSAGVVLVDPSDGRTLDALLAEADAGMYAEKRARRASRAA
jgi:diguanylate cyclase (GGDEF)-like protein